jgi:hypothetical protein
MKEKHYSSTEIFILTDIEATGLAMTTPAGGTRQLRAKRACAASIQYVLNYVAPQYLGVCYMLYDILIRPSGRNLQDSRVSTVYA